MKKLVILLAVLLLIAAAVAVYFVVTTPGPRSGVVRFPLTAAQRSLLASVPDSAESFAFVPSAASARAKLLSNPVTAPSVEQWSASRRFPPPWVVGNADLLVWRSGKQTTLVLRLDPLRAFLARAFMTLSADEAQSGGTRLLLEPSGEPPIPSAELDAILALASALPPGDAFAVQRSRSRGAFPPIPRPAVSSVAATAKEITIVSRAPRSAEARPGGALVLPRLPRTAVLTAAFATPPRAIEDMNRLVAAKVSTLLRDGGSIVLYDVDTAKLLPRPREVIVLPASPERRVALAQFLDETLPQQVREAVGVRIETADTGSELLVAFDRSSLERYQHDTFDAPVVQASSWLVHIDPQRAVPMLEQISESPGLRYIAPRLFRSARDLRGWIQHLRAARSIEAGDSVDGAAEELRVRIGS